MSEYRSERGAATARREALSQERRHLRPELKRLRALEQRDRDLAAEIERIDRELEAADAWKDRLRIAKPCTASWEAMAGDDCVRHCRLCDQSVYNVAEMSAAEVAGLLHTGTDSLCIRLRKREDGRAVDGDCGSPTPSRAPSRVRSTTAGLVVCGAASAVVAGAVAVTTLPTMGGVNRYHLARYLDKQEAFSSAKPRRRRHHRAPGPRAQAEFTTGRTAPGVLETSGLLSDDGLSVGAFFDAWRSIPFSNLVAMSHIAPGAVYRFDVGLTFDGRTGGVTEVNVILRDGIEDRPAATFRRLVRDHARELRVTPFGDSTVRRTVPIRVVGG